MIFRLFLSSASANRFVEALLIIPVSNKPQPLTVIDALTQGPPPVLIIQIPAHGLRQTTFEILLGPPAQFLLQLAGINGITLVVTGPVRHEFNQIAARF